MTNTVCKLKWSSRRCTNPRRDILPSQPMKSTKTRMLQRHMAAHLPLALRELGFPGPHKTSALRHHNTTSRNSDSMSMHGCLRHFHCLAICISHKNSTHSALAVLETHVDQAAFVLIRGRTSMPSNAVAQPCDA